MREAGRELISSGASLAGVVPSRAWRTIREESKGRARQFVRGVRWKDRIE